MVEGSLVPSRVHARMSKGERKGKEVSAWKITAFRTGKEFYYEPEPPLISGCGQHNITH